MRKENSLKIWLYQIYTTDMNILIQGIITADSLEKAKIEAHRIKEKAVYSLAKKCLNTIYTGIYLKVKVEEYDKK